MTSRAYRKCLEIIGEIVEAHPEDVQVTLYELTLYINKHVGIDDRTVRRYVEALKRFQFVRQMSPTAFMIVKGLRQEKLVGGRVRVES